jgi:hypothetical protein
MRKLNLAGQRFGHLVVKQPGPGRRWKHHVVTTWLCQCDCGRWGDAVTAHLRSGASISCAHPDCAFHNPIRTGNPQESSLRYLYQNYKCNAKVRGHEFGLSLEQFRKFTKQVCNYCGAEPGTVYQHKWKGIKLESTKNRPYVYNGVDRVVNETGYTIDNCVTCCKICNIMKQGLSKEDFLAHIKRILTKEETNGAGHSSA